MHLERLINFFLVSCQLIGYKLSEALQCVDENNYPVDWFVVYKFPKIKHSDKLIAEGVGYTYITSSGAITWSLSNHSINATNSIIGQTLSPFYNNLSTANFIFYNDQPPNQKAKLSKGHTKGVVLADEDSGFWLIHSTPHFPQLTPKYRFSPSGLLKGQSFLCISLNYKNLNKVGVQLQYNQPQIFAKRLNKDIQLKLIEIVKAAEGETVARPPWYKKVILSTINGVNFTSFAKASPFGKELYEDWVAPALQTNLLVESWLNGPGRLASNCTKPFKVYNVEKISLDSLNIRFNTSQDHSKWAASQDSTWICIGDINRMQRQKRRGGGTVCLDNENLLNNYRNAIDTIEKCQN